MGIIGAVNIRVAILPIVGECQCRSGDNEDVNFRQHAPQIGYHSNVS